MKYRFIICLFLTLFVLSGVLNAAARSHVTVFYVSGKAEYLPSGAADWKKVKANTKLYSGDSVKTYDDSSVEIAFDKNKNNMTSVNPNTQVIIKLYDTEKIELIDGEVFALVKSIPRGSSFEIRTPTAVCGARGTGFGANGNKERTVVSAYENSSFVKGINKDGSLMTDEVTIPQGLGSMVKRFDKPSKPTNISQKDMDRWNKWKSDIADRLSGRRTVRQRLARDLDKIQDKKSNIVERKDSERIDKRTEKTGAGEGTCDTGRKTQED